MSWTQIFTDKPWLPEAAGEVPDTDTGKAPGQIALRMLLGAITILFLLFFVTFIERSQFQDFHALAGEPWQPFTDSMRLWVNTGVLLLASLCLHWAVRTSQKQQAILLLLGGGFFAALFVVLQVSVWQFLYNLGYGLAENPANSYFYMLTGVHATHIIGGLFALLLVGRKYLAGADTGVALRACATYWHYLFVLWLVLFFMLTRTPETYAIIAAFCGLG
ncbi:cytochrome c oxidase subunit 3 [Litorivivens lipolytica]|uniref:Cytochrome c oxidase subunit 3 n=1 Tax=Litorivivens lipolytica TaxID=1524264 RepID=A0A7W4Z868_9GAMM|nr:cytochrome c oxidase subunit 3 [Litorivivens lipolytica]MBB3048646.1 cytochrome c oxidase subunit 3 [Litorivivens lipolytica]